MWFLHINAEWREILRIFWYMPLPLISLLSPQIKRSKSPPLLSPVLRRRKKIKRRVYIYLVEDEVSAVVSDDLCDSDDGEVWGVVEVVDDDDAEAPLEQLQHRVAADVPNAVEDKPRRVAVEEEPRRVGVETEPSRAASLLRPILSSPATNAAAACSALGQDFASNSYEYFFRRVEVRFYFRAVEGGRRPNSGGTFTRPTQPNRFL
jgi:hypothetical protein